jgi:hypothetical protein
MKKINLEGFKRPSGCPLSRKAEAKMLEEFRKKGGKISPFDLCVRWTKCPGKVHLECFIQTINRGDQKIEK